MCLRCGLLWEFRVFPLMGWMMSGTRRMSYRDLVSWLATQRSLVRVCPALLFSILLGCPLAPPIPQADGPGAVADSGNDMLDASAPHPPRDGEDAERFLGACCFGTDCSDAVAGCCEELDVDRCVARGGVFVDSPAGCAGTDDVGSRFVCSAVALIATDSDNDGLTDAEEERAGSDPFASTWTATAWRTSTIPMLTETGSTTRTIPTSTATESLTNRTTTSMATASPTPWTMTLTAMAYPMMWTKTRAGTPPARRTVVSQSNAHGCCAQTRGVDKTHRK